MAEYRCALVGAASFDAEHFKREMSGFDCIVAVDGGYQSLASIGVKPTVAVGDFDSLGFVPQDVPVCRHPAMKDDSDTALALQWAREQGFDSVAVYGALGGRLDHTMASLQALAGAARGGMRVAAVGESSVVLPLIGPAHLDLPAAMEGTLSVFSMADESCGVTIAGLKYAARNATLTNDVTLGLSNEFVGTPSRIALERGTLLIFLPRLPLSAL